MRAAMIASCARAARAAARRPPALGARPVLDSGQLRSSAASKLGAVALRSAWASQEPMRVSSPRRWRRGSLADSRSASRRSMWSRQPARSAPASCAVALLRCGARRRPRPKLVAALAISSSVGSCPSCGAQRLVVSGDWARSRSAASAMCGMPSRRVGRARRELLAVGPGSPASRRGRSPRELREAAT